MKKRRLKNKTVFPGIEISGKKGGVKPGKKIAGNLLAKTALAGFLLSIVLCWAAVYFSVKASGAGKNTAQTGEDAAGNSFRRELSLYDGAYPKETARNLEKRLSRLEKLAQSQEEWLSVLKRARGLARENPAFLPDYRDAVYRAARQFPHSAAISAVAVEAAFLGRPGRDDKPEAFEADFFAAELSLEAAADFSPLILAFHVLSGSFRDPFMAASIPGVEAFLPAGLSRLPLELQSALKIDEILVRTLLGDAEETPFLINRLIEENPERMDYIRFGAEYFYDYGHFLRAASLFSRMGGDASLSLEADALARAGEIKAARNIWNILGQSSPADANGSGRSAPPEIIERSLYNLAASAEEKNEALFWLEKLLTLRENLKNEEGNALTGAEFSPAELFGVIRYTRFQDTPKSVAILEESLKGENTELSGGPGSAFPGERLDSFLALELLRRKFEIWPPDRRIPELWLLLGNRPEDEALYFWGAVYFDRQKLYEESAQLLKIAEGRGFNGNWLQFHSALALLRSGKLEAGEKLLRIALASPSEDAGFTGNKAAQTIPQWIIYANLGRIAESRRSISVALKNYETAADLAGENRAAARVQLRISRCLEAMGRLSEIRTHLERALELDPGDVRARHEISRINGMGIYSD